MEGEEENTRPPQKHPQQGALFIGAQPRLSLVSKTENFCPLLDTSSNGSALFFLLFPFFSFCLKVKEKKKILIFEKTLYISLHPKTRLNNNKEKQDIKHCLVLWSAGQRLVNK